MNSVHGAVLTGLIPAATAGMAVLGRRAPPARLLGGAGHRARGRHRVRAGPGRGRLRGGDVLLLVAIAVAGLGYAEGGALARKYGGWRVICWAVIVALPVTVPVTIAAALANPPRQLSAGAVIGLAYVSLVSMGLGFFAWYAGLASGGVARVGRLQLAQPALTLGWSALLLGEQVSLLDRGRRRGHRGHGGRAQRARGPGQRRGAAGRWAAELSGDPHASADRPPPVSCGSAAPGQGRRPGSGGRGRGRMRQAGCLQLSCPDAGSQGDPRGRRAQGAGQQPGQDLLSADRATKLDLVRYYLSVADGALRGVAAAMVLKRFVHGAGSEAFFQKRAPSSRPGWIETIMLSFPSGRTAEEVVVRDAAGLAWVVNLGCIDLNPHPVRAEDLDHPDELRVDLDPVPGVDWPQIVRVALVAREVLSDFGLTGWPKTSDHAGCTSTRGSSRAGPSPRCAAPRSRWPGRSSAGRPMMRRRGGGRKSATASSSITTRTRRTGRSPPPTRSGPRRCPGLDPAELG